MYAIITKAIENKIEKWDREPIDICSGDCTTFAKQIINEIEIEEGYKIVIVDNLSDEMKSELTGYETIPAEYSKGISHCYIAVIDEDGDKKYFDAFNPDGVWEEEDLSYHFNCR